MGETIMQRAVVRAVGACILVSSLALGQVVAPIPRERCTPASAGRSAATWLRAAMLEVAPSSAGTGSVLQFTESTDARAWEQSDRAYPPFLPSISTKRRWFSLATGIEGSQDASRPAPSAGRYPAAIAGPAYLMSGRDTSAMPMPFMYAFVASERGLNPWAVLHDWRADSAHVELIARCVARDVPAIVLGRGQERLYVAEDDATPLMLVRPEPVLLWRSAMVTYLWNTWWQVAGGGKYPLAAFRIVEGTEQLARAVVFASARMMPSDSAPRLSIPVAPEPMSAKPGFGIPLGKPDTLRVGANTFLLRRADYTETVALRRDTVFLLDATGDEARARHDSTWIAQLFPGRHPVVLVVTDLAWPHVGGVRFWVARGATIVSHALSREFLSRLVERRMVDEPDELERMRKRPRLRFRAVTDSLRLAGGEVVVHALRGLASSGAVAAWLPADRFVWVGDYVQNVGAPTTYARDVVRTMQTVGVHPVRFGAQHVPQGDWQKLMKLFEAPR